MFTKKAVGAEEEGISETTEKAKHKVGGKHKGGKAKKKSKKGHKKHSKKVVAKK